MVKCLKLILLSSIFCFADPIERYESTGANAYSNYVIQFNLFSQKLISNSFYTYGNPAATKAFFSHGNVLTSFNALIQLPLFMGMNWTSHPTSSSLPIYSVLNLINGEIGLNLGKSNIGLLNSFQLYFTRSPYHQAGIIYRYDFQNFGEYSFAVLEEDRMNDSNPKLLLQLGCNFGGKATETTF